MSAIRTETPIGGPGWKAILPTMTGFRGRPIEFLLDLGAKHGPLAKFQLGPIRCYLATGPEAVATVLQGTDVYYKDNLTRYIVTPLFGGGLGLSDGGDHRRKRKMIAPALYATRIKTYAPIMSQYVQDVIGGWKEGDTFQLEHLMTDLTLRIIARTMFNSQMVGTEELLHAIQTVVVAVGRKLKEPIPIPYAIPTKGNREMLAALKFLEDLIYRVMDEFRNSGEEVDNVLAMLLRARDENGQPLTDKQIRDEMMELMIAGHETCAHLLTWLFYELDRHPEVRAKLEAEIDMVLGDQPATYEDIRRLTYTEMVLKEALRLYPAVWLTSREPIRDVELLGHKIAKGSIIFISPFVSHRLPAQFDNPEAFDPERFAGRPDRGWSACRYYPFGAGAHICAGVDYAIVESTLILAAIIRKARLHRVDHKPIQMIPGATIRPDDPIPVRVELR
jgi:cytochrome P450